MIDYLRRKWALYWLLRDDRTRAKIAHNLRRKLYDADRWLGIQHVDEN